MANQARILDIQPPLGIPGGDVTVFCDGLSPFNLEEDALHFCGAQAMIEGASTHKLVTHIPEEIVGDEVYVVQGGESSVSYRYPTPPCIAHALHVVGNPAVTAEGRVFATFSGSKGQFTPVSVFRIDPGEEKVPVISGLMNATALLAGRDGRLYVSSRYDGKVYASDHDGNYGPFSQGLGEAFGMAMDSRGSLFVGDRSGTVFRVGPGGDAQFFARLPASNVAYHLAIDSRDRLYVTAPQSVGENTIWRVLPDGTTEEFRTELAEFHGIAVDAADMVWVSMTNQGKGSLQRIDPATGERKRVLSGDEIIGLAFGPGGDLVLATFSRLYTVPAAELARALAATRT